MPRVNEPQTATHHSLHRTIAANNVTTAQPRQRAPHCQGLLTAHRPSTTHRRHNVVVYEQHPHEYHVTVQQSSVKAPRRRDRRRHRGRFAHFTSPPRILHRKGQAVSAMAATRPQGTAASSHPVRILIWTATRPGATNGRAWRRSE